MQNTKPPAEQVKKKSSLHEWVEAIVVAALLALVIRTFIIQAYRIPTGSMRTTLLEGDAILVNKFLLGTPVEIPFTQITLFHMPGFKKPERGDIIVFKFPEDTSKDFIKRLIGKPGETVEIRNGSIYINDKPVTDPVFNGRYYYNRGPFGEAGKKITVPPGSYFMLGDNSFSSQDSRYWGFVPENYIRGKAMVIYWPPTRWRLTK